MARCVSWRSHPAKQHVGHLPRQCRECWSPCRDKVAKRGLICEQCLAALVSHPLVEVRSSLLLENSDNRAVLELLAEDASPIIAGRAEALLASLDGNLETGPATSPHPGKEPGPLEPVDWFEDA